MPFVKTTRRIRLCLAVLLCLCLPLSLSAQGKSPGAPGQNAPPPKLPPEVQKAADQYSKAVKLQMDRKLPEALAAYKEYVRLAKAANLAPQSLLPAYQNMAAIYQYLITQQQEVRQNTEGLDATLREIAHIDPNNAGVHVQLALLASQAQKADDARHFANRALQLKPDNNVAGTAHFVLGNLAAVKKDYPTSSREFGTAAKLMPKNPLVFFNYGLSLAEEKKYKESLAAFEQARKLDPKVNNVDAYIAAVQQQMNQGDSALAEYERILQSDPHNVNALLNRASLLDKKGQTDAAISAYQSALAVVPNDYGAHFNVARLYSALRNFAAAGRHYLLAHHSVAGKDAARDAAALAGLAASEQQQGRSLFDATQRAASLKASEEHYKQAIALAPGDNALIFQLGSLYEQVARYADAIALYTKQFHVTPNDSLLYRHLANVYVMQRNLPDFIKTWQGYQQKFPDDPISYQEITNIYEKVGGWEEAVAEWRLLLARKPVTSLIADAHNNIAKDLVQLKRDGEARTQYQAALALDDKAANVPKASQAAEIAGIQAEQIRALRGLAEIAETENKSDEALQWLEQVRTREADIYHKANRPINGQIYRDIALLYERSNKADMAIKTYLELAQALPTDFRAYQELGRLYEAQNQLDRALSAYDRAASLPGNPNPLADRLKIGVMYQRHAQFDKAIAAYEALLAQYPNNKEIMTALAQVYRQAGQDAKALPLYDALQKLDPTLRWVEDARAVALTRLKRYEEARALYLRQIERDPENRQNYANLAFVWAQEGKPDAFLEWIKPRLEKMPASPTLMAVTLDEFARQKHEEAGWAYLQNLVEKNKAQRQVLESYASLLQQRQKKAESLAVYRRIAAQYPDNLSAQTMLADQLDYNSLNDEANKIYLTLLARTNLPDAARKGLRRQLGGRYAGQGKWPDAIAQFQEIIRQDPKDFDATMTLGTILEKAGHEPEALTLYNSVLKEMRFPAFVLVDAHNRLGGLYEKQNNRPEAIRHYQEALKLDGENVRASESLRRLGIKQG